MRCTHLAAKTKLLFHVPRERYSADFAHGTGQSIGCDRFQSVLEEKDLALKIVVYQGFYAGKLVSAC